jgi:hypothetical protein
MTPVCAKCHSRIGAVARTATVSRLISMDAHQEERRGTIATPVGFLVFVIIMLVIVLIGSIRG